MVRFQVTAQYDSAAEMRRKAAIGSRQVPEPKCHFKV